jgi:bla regulator protein blaR1
MKTLNQLFPQDLTQAIGYTILHSLWQGVLIAVTLTVLFFFLHRQTAILRYRVALGALSLQLLFAGLTFAYYYQAANLAGQSLDNAQIKASFLFQPINETAAFFSWTNISLFFQAQLPLIVTVWLLGLAIMLLRFLGGLAYLQRLRTYKNTPLPAVWQQRMQSLSKRLNLNKPVSGAESALVKTPLVIGYFNPLILLPLGTISDLPLNQVEAILAHELAHIRRHDYLVNILQNLIEALFFYHPAIWWVSDFVRVERENCCDDQAIAICGDKMVYAQALTNLAQIKSQTPDLALALAGKDGSVLGRIKRLFRPTEVKPTFTESFVAAAIMLLFLTTISVAAAGNYAAKKIISPPRDTAEVSVKNAAPVKINASKIISLADSTQKKKEVVLIQDKDGKLLSLTINGVNVPQDQLHKYENYILEAPVGSAVLGANTTLKGKIIIHKSENTGPKSPQKVTTPTTPRIIEVIKVNAPAPTAKVAPVAESKGAISANRNRNFTISGHGPEPLYILDGQPINKVEMNKINPNTIEKIDVLKGASTEIYGEAGKNGVVLITTKPGAGAAKTAESNAQSTKIVIEENSINHSVTVREGAGAEIPDVNNTTEQNVLTRDHEAKTEKILQELKKDNLYSNDKNYTLKLTNSGMYINQVKQPDALYQKYRKYLPYPNKNVTNQTFEINGRFREK